MAFRLAEEEIRKRLIAWRNLKQLHRAARERIARLLAENTQLKSGRAKLKQLLKTKDSTIQQLRNQLADKEAQRKELLGYLYKETKKKEGQQQRAQRQGAYHRPKPKEEDITEERTFSLNRCPLCNTHVGEAVDEVTKYEED